MKSYYIILFLCIPFLLFCEVAGQGDDRQKARMISDASNLKSLGLCLKQYTMDFDDKFPMDPGFLCEYDYCVDGIMYVCCGAINPTPLPKDGDDIRNGYCDFLYFGTGRKESDFTKDEPVMCTKPGIYGNDYIIVLYNNGRVSTYKDIPSSVREAITKNEKRLQKLGEPIRGFIDVSKQQNKLVFEYTQEGFLYSFRPGYGTCSKVNDRSMKVSGRTIKFKLSDKSDQILLTILNIIERDKLYEPQPAGKLGRGYIGSERIIFNTGVHSGEFYMNRTPGKDFTLLSYQIYLLFRSLQTDLMTAIWKADLKEVEQLLETDIDINAQDMNGTTALMLAAKHGYSRIAEKLLAKKADTALEDWNGTTALGWAMKRDHKAVTKILRDAGADVNKGNPVLVEAVWKNPDKISELIKGGVNVDTRDSRGKTALMDAVSINKIDTARLLIKLGADVNAKDNEGCTPLIHGSEYLDSTKLLLKHGADVNAVTKEGITVLQAATQVTRTPPTGDKAAVIKLLLKHGAKTRKQTLPVIGKDWIVPELQMEFVWIDSLKAWVGKYEVTNAQYRIFKPSHSSGKFKEYDLDNDRQPVVRISLEDALTYAKWLTKKEEDAKRLPDGFIYRLPNGKEWTTFAKCGDKRLYPWGNKFPPSYGNYRDISMAKAFGYKDYIKNYNDGFVVSCPVSKSGSNKWGLFGVGGNAVEWIDESCSFCYAKGSSFFHFPDRCNGFSRYWKGSYEGVGFRLILAPRQKPPPTFEELFKRPSNPERKDREK